MVTWSMTQQEDVPGGSGAPTIALIESVMPSGEVYVLVAALGHNRTTPFTTRVSFASKAPVLDLEHTSLTSQQVRSLTSNLRASVIDGPIKLRSRLQTVDPPFFRLPDQ